MICLIVCFSWSTILKLLCSSANELQKTQMFLLEKNNYIPQILTVLLYCIFMVFAFLWLFVFCLSFVSNNLNNVTCLLSNQCLWSDSRPINFMEFFVTESQKFLLAKCLHATAGSEEKWLFSQATQSKTPVKYLEYDWGKIGGFGIDWYNYLPVS